ncbi:RnfABCDGE type electron transport complex subunit B [Legionella bononiensis]|uniref:RnfABCDGE type electron transport complex subunit B n=1 Tax=Legionella bononiensis TaxID=2793102 RepID=A0ABS1WG51_9GAMM|nr:RnfABCDGE type electron transport complex subunit B [Legionella bononiensis]MBL7481707.1 RnfABCDGE type electron transport complex subunit B [Legionella bononiensis]MBL7528255.1 RnfABCDGE type electron transport complex subunit B [Legionella bononiensis]MBL7562730.1 RnfABCDGE type electron transport complex subunit B [Legionella bononiensis]
MVTVKEVDALLPQTQCGECNYPGCMPYAEALVQGTALINKCPPGGVETVKALGALLRVDPAPYLEEAIERTRQPSVAVIREAECIGCTKCIKACPVDAIIGSGKLMHAVITHECTGCGLCVEPCPVDCIEMMPLEEPAYDKDVARDRYNARQARLLREEHEKQQIYREKRQLAMQSKDRMDDVQAKQDYIQQALARVKAKRL